MRYNAQLCSKADECPA